MKKGLSVLLCLIMFFSLFSGSVVNAEVPTVENNEQQIESIGGSNPTDGSLKEGKVGISKTIAPTETENYFDITLQTKAHASNEDKSTDVVLVMDISNTMNYAYDNRTPNEQGEVARIEDAKDAANDFIKKFCEDKELSLNRKLGVVTFNSNAQWAVPMSDANSTDKVSGLQAQVDQITAPSDDAIRWTNIEAGLTLAYNYMKGSTAQYKYVILLTDGFPTTYIEGDKTSTTSLKGWDVWMKNYYASNQFELGFEDRDGAFYDTVTQKMCLYGVDYSDKGAQKAQDIANTMHNEGINIFSIGVAIGSQTIDGYASQWVNSNFTTVDRRSTTYVIGDGSDYNSYANWLRDSIAGGPNLTEESTKYSGATEAEMLETVFENILKDIEMAPRITMTYIDTVDPMGVDVEFMNFYDKDGNVVEGTVLTGQSKENAENDANFTNDTIYWDLLKSGFTRNEDGDFVYTLKYRVRLENEKPGFVFNSEIFTNDNAVLNYGTQEVQPDGSTSTVKDNELPYPDPKVEGYYGQLSFTKIGLDETGEVVDESLAGATFTLSHFGDTCTVCHGDAQIADVSVTSGEDGIISFDKIPSGHHYMLKETGVPENYQPTEVHIVIVSYGKTYFDSKEVTDSYPGRIENTKIAPAEVLLTAKKTLDGKAPENGEFQFKLALNDEDYQLISNDGSGTVTFRPWVFESAGDYVLTLSEVQGTDGKIVYDKTVYKAYISVTYDEEKQAHVAETTIKKVDAQGNETVYTETPSFANITKTPAEVVLTASKTLSDKDGNPVTMEAGDFAFELTGKDVNGNDISDVKTNAADGKVTFDKLTFDKAGTYTYTVKEKDTYQGSENSHYVYDKSEYTATVVVTDEGNHFKASVSYTKDGTTSDAISFANQIRKPATVSIEALKTLNGGTLENGQFTFQLSKIDGETITTVEEKTNDADGKISFTTLTFEEAGVFTYEISEVAGEAGKGIIYDGSKYRLVISVSPTATDSYVADAALLKIDADGTQTFMDRKNETNISFTAAQNISFTNIQDVELTVDKTVTGFMGDKKLDFDFTLTVKDPAGNPYTNLTPVTGLTNNNDGTYSFKLKDSESIKIGIPYGYTYTVAETQATGYDTTVKINDGEEEAKATVEGTITTDTSVSYVNDKDNIPDTGITLDSTPFTGIFALIAVLAISVAVMWNAKRRALRRARYYE